MPGLAGMLAEPGAAILDIGTGVGWLAVAMAQTYPAARVTGLDIYEPSLALAAENVAGSGVADRVEVRRADACDLDEPSTYDLVWVAGPFLPAAIVPTVLDRAADALRPGGWIVFGLYAAADHPAASALNDLRIVRSGGHPWSPEEAGGLLEAAGLGEIAVIERAWPAPIQFVVGRRPHAPSPTA